MGEKQFDINSCEVNENGELVCEELDKPEFEDQTVTVVERADVENTFLKKPDVPEDAEVV